VHVHHSLIIGPTVGIKIQSQHTSAMHVQSADHSFVDGHKCLSSAWSRLVIHHAV